MKAYQIIHYTLSATTILMSLTSAHGSSNGPTELVGSWMILPPQCVEMDRTSASKVLPIAYPSLNSGGNGPYQSGPYGSGPYGSPYGSPYGQGPYGSPYGGVGPYQSGPYGNPYGTSSISSGDREDTEPNLSELSFVLNIEPTHSSFIEVDRDLLTGVVCKHSEVLVNPFGANQQFSIESTHQIDANPENDGSCPALSVRSLVELYQFTGHYQFYAHGNSFTAVSMDNTYCAKQGMAGLTLILTFYRMAN